MKQYLSSLAARYVTFVAVLHTLRKACWYCWLLLIPLFISGCTSTEQVMNSWYGHHIEELIADWGAPGSTSHLEDGRRIYSWVSNWGSAYLMNTCRQSFTTSSNGIIQSWRFTGCPHWQMSPGKGI